MLDSKPVELTMCFACMSKRLCAIGITSNTIHEPSTVTQEELLHTIHTVNKDFSVDGLLVQLPLPGHISK